MSSATETGRLVHSFLVEEAGQDLIEYGFIMGLIALAAIVALSGLSHTLANALAIVGNTITNST